MLGTIYHKTTQGSLMKVKFLQNKIIDEREFIEKMFNKGKYTSLLEAQHALDTFKVTLTELLLEGNAIDFKDFGHFSLSYLPSRQGTILKSKGGAEPVEKQVELLDVKFKSSRKYKKNFLQVKLPTT